jgi:flagellar basal body-associated protein FliL
MAPRAAPGGSFRSCNRFEQGSFLAIIRVNRRNIMVDQYRTEHKGGGAGRTILIILVVAVLVVIVAFATGMINLSSTGGSLPKVAVEGGSLPKVDADVGSVDVGTKATTVEVPKVETKTETVKVPTLEVKKAN